MKTSICWVFPGLLFGLGAAFTGCSGDEETSPEVAWECTLSEGEEADYTESIGCQADFDVLAAEPADSSLSGALSVKSVIDRVDDNHLYFQDSEKFPLHFDFASEYLSAKDGLPVIANQEEFNENYYSPQRRFFLGAITYYEGPDKWVYELSPYDTADADLITEAYNLVRSATFFGEELYYHPSGAAAEEVAESLPASVNVISTDELYEGIDYQALNLGSGCGRLVFFTAQELEDEYVSFQDIVVLDSVPNDISVAQGLITAEFQTPLSHVNVLSRNRGTPNMGLRGAFEDDELRALEGKWVRLMVGAFDYEVEEIDQEAADACIEKPEAIVINPMDLSVTELTDVTEIYDPESDVPMREQISLAVPAFGGKASHYAVLHRVEEANVPDAFVIPVYFYDQFMKQNGFDVRVAEMLEDAEFTGDPAVRDVALAELRQDMAEAPIDLGLLAALTDKLEAEYPGIRMRFRSSTNAEDLGDFTGAGLYTSESGSLGDVDEAIEDALREVWGSVWFFRAFEERSYLSIDHLAVGMALLVHRSFPEEEANGVAVTANPFDSSGMEPAFYVNVQYGSESVVQPRYGLTTDQFIYYYAQQGQPAVYVERSNLVPEGESVLTTAQTHELGTALLSIHQHFSEAYGPASGNNGWYAMDVEFKFDDGPEGEPVLFVKQARPYPGKQ